MRGNEVKADKMISTSVSFRIRSYNNRQSLSSGLNEEIKRGLKYVFYTTVQRINSCREIIELLGCSNSGIWLSSFLLNGSIGVLIAYYPDYSLGTLTKLQLGGSIASLYVCAMIASLLAGSFRVREKTIIRIGVIFSIFGALFAIKYPFLGFSSLGGGSGLATVGYALTAARVNVDRGLVMGLFNTTIFAGLSLVPIVAGIFTGFLSFENLFIANGFILAGALMLKE